MPELPMPEGRGDMSQAHLDSPEAWASGTSLPAAWDMPTVQGLPAPEKNGEGENHHFVQAPMRALDEDGINVAVFGTVVFALVTLILAWRLPALRAHQAGWWFWVGIAGTVQGMLGLWYCVRRKALRLAGKMA